jgi:hypothetical protein
MRLGNRIHDEPVLFDDCLERMALDFRELTTADHDVDIDLERLWQ